MNNNELAKDIVNKIVAEVNGSLALQYKLEAALQDTIMKSVLDHANKIVREECRAEGIDTGELSRSLEVSSQNQLDWESEIVRKLAIIACKELRKVIEIRQITESSYSEERSKSSKLIPLFG